jgi:hypothetical protein
MTSLEMRQPLVLFSSILAALLTAFLLVAMISPQVNIDIPGVRGCKGACFDGGGAGGD